MANGLGLLREYVNREFAAQTTINRVLLLWAAARLPGLLEPDRQKAIIGELLERQQDDGGWSLASLSGDWKRVDGTYQEKTSDGYATGLITFVLQQAGISPENSKLKRGLAWLTANQNKTEGCWPAYSLNKNKKNHMVESRGTESVLNALILSSRDAQNGQLSNDAHRAFENMWAEQQIAGKQKGAWLWLRFKNEPHQSGDRALYE